MINLRELELLRVPGLPGDDRSGAFVIRHHATDALLRVIASAYGDWDHVSVSLENRCPTWEEMDLIKRLFFYPTETVMQLHPPLSDHVNIHPHCLHLWRPQKQRIPMPPQAMV